VAPLKRWARSYIRSGREEIAEVLAFENTIPNVSACLVDRKAAVAAVETAQGFRTCGDWVFYLELLHQGKVAYHAEVLNLHRRHGTSIINRSSRNRSFISSVPPPTCWRSGLAGSTSRPPGA
jgi:hypothetical protein